MPHIQTHHGPTQLMSKLENKTNKQKWMRKDKPIISNIEKKVLLRQRFLPSILNPAPIKIFGFISMKCVKKHQFK